MTKYILELEPGVWWSEGPGDPPRTTIESSAMKFSAHGYARIALGCALKFRPFPAARIVTIKPIHHRLGDWAKVAACGARLSRVDSSLDPEESNCPKCRSMSPVTNPPHRKPPSGPTVPESRRREKGQHRLTLRLSDDEMDSLVSLALPSERTPQAVLRRLVREDIARGGSYQVVD